MHNRRILQKGLRLEYVSTPEASIVFNKLRSVGVVVGTGNERQVARLV